MDSTKATSLNKPFASVKAFLFALFVSLVLCAGFTLAQPAEKAYAASDKYEAKITFQGYGTVTLELDRSAAPITVDNFVNLANSGFYNGTTIHRVVSGFMIQGGDPKGDGTGGSGTNIAGEFAENGWNNPISHKRGVISMARATNVNSASSQFFICHADSTDLDGHYAAFGHVTSGMSVVDAIANLPRVSGTETPVNKPVITSITVTPIVYSDSDGKWVKSGSRWWYQNDTATKMATGKSYPYNEWKTINGKRYHFDGNGWMHANWFNDGSNWYWLGSDGAMKTGWIKTGGKWYYMDSDGTMMTGKRSIGGATYFLNSPNGDMKTGWNAESDGWYFYNGSGAMVTGWAKTGGKWYWMNNNGLMQANGMKYIKSGTTYNYYWLNADGSMRTGWFKEKDNWYYAKPSGELLSGILTNVPSNSNKAYFFNWSCVMQTGIQQINEYKYYFKPSGELTTGWVLDGGKWYYFHPQGPMLTNMWIGDYWVGSDGVMATNAWVGASGKYYYVDGSGKWVKSMGMKESLE